MIYLIRHTAPDVAKGVCYGQSDVGLADSYSAELADIRAKLPDDIALCYSSPLQRCLRLANDLFPSKISTDKRLQELDFGDWELKKWNDLGQSGIDWGNNFVTYRPPNGETVLELHHRVLQFWQELITKNGSNNFAIITHAGVIRVILAYQKGLPLEQAYDISVTYGQVISINAV